LWDNGTPRWQIVLANSGTTLHLYGKAKARRGRKMGHYTCVARTVDDALDAALRLRGVLPACSASGTSGRSPAKVPQSNLL
jgi:5-(carboxyamino)imidazole ribonucleotide synthase